MSVNILLKFTGSNQILPTLDQVSLQNEWITFDTGDIHFDNMSRARYAIDKDRSELILDTNSSLYNYIGAAAYLIANQAKLPTITDLQDGHPEPTSNYQKYVNLVLTDLTKERLNLESSGELFTTIIPGPTKIPTKETFFQAINQLNSTHSRTIFKFGIKFLEYIENNQLIRLWFHKQQPPRQGFYLETAKDWRSNSKFVDDCHLLAKELGGKVVTTRPESHHRTEEELLKLM